VLKVGDLVRIKIRYCNYSTVDDIGIVKAVDKDFYRKRTAKPQDRVTVIWCAGGEAHEPIGLLEIAT
jgi:hypothetical protein